VSPFSQGYNHLIEKEHHMEVVTALLGMTFAFVLTALIAAVITIGKALRGADQNRAAEGLVPNEHFTPLNLSPPGTGTGAAMAKEAQGIERKRSSSAGLWVFPPAMPFNYPNI
jgi:hypothetical protein